MLQDAKFPDGEENSTASTEDRIARMQERIRGLERTLRTRLSELEAADRHIAKLEGKLLGLKEAKKQLKQLKAEKQALRKSPERKVGQVLLAPYLLPKKLIREVKKRRGRPVVEAPAATDYQAWLERHRASVQELEAMREEARTFTSPPLISIITPVFNTAQALLEAAVNSVSAQVYEKWELVLIDDASTDAQTIDALKRLTSCDSRIRSVRLPKNGGIAAASNEGLRIAIGDWVGLFDHDDLLEPDALFQIAKLLQTNADADLIYSDEDKITEAGFDAPSLKPDWSPDFFLSYNYLCHFTAFRRSLIDEVGGFQSEFDGAQDYDLFLRISEKTQRIHHIPRVLYHWRRSATSTADNIRRKPEALEAGRNAIDAHLRRCGEAAHTAIDWRTHAYWVKREIKHARKVSIIIVAGDRNPNLARCLETLTAQTHYHEYEIVIVSRDRESLPPVPHRLLHYEGPFSPSAMKNFAVAQTDAPWLLFLSGDAEIIEGEWLTAMVEHVQRSEVGAVGARLLNPDDTVRHAGVVLGIGGIAQTTFRGFTAEEPGVCRQLQVMRNYSAVTSDCLLTRRDVFEEVGGFDEAQLPATFGDVDLCLKMRRAGYLIVYTPFAKLYRHESATAERSAESSERDLMRERWADVLARDPYYNPNLSRAAADFSLGK